MFFKYLLLIFLSLRLSETAPITVYSWKEYIVHLYWSGADENYTVPVVAFDRNTTSDKIFHPNHTCPEFPFYMFSTHVNGVSFGYQKFNYDGMTPPGNAFFDTVDWYSAGSYNGPHNFSQLPDVITSIPQDQWTAMLLWAEGGLGGGDDDWLFITGITKTLIEPNISTHTFSAQPSYDPTLYRWREYILVVDWTTDTEKYTVPIVNIPRNASQDQVFYPGSKYVPFYIFSILADNHISFGYQDYNYDGYAPPHTPFFDTVNWHPSGVWEDTHLDYNKLPSSITSIPKDQWTSSMISANGGMGGGTRVYLFITGLTQMKITE